MNLWRRRFAPLALLLGASNLGTTTAAAPDDGVAFFESRIRPVLVKHCYGCHSREAGKAKAGLYLDSREGIRRGGASGPAVVPGDPEASLLVLAIRFVGDEPDMPPKQALWLSPAQIADLEAWVKMGAPDPVRKAPQRRRPPSTGTWRARSGPFARCRSRRCRR